MPTGVLNNVMQEDQKGYKKNNVRAEEEQTTAARTKQREDEEQDTGIRPAGRGKQGNKERNTAKKNKTSKTTTSAIATAFALPPLNSPKKNKNYHSP